MNVLSQSPDVSVLIVAYNSAAVISGCIASIPQACTQHSYEVLLIDNGDSSTEALVAAAFPHVRIVPSKGNVGFAAGNNLLAAEAQGRHLLLLNPDVELKPNALDRLLEAASTYASASAWGGVTLDRNDQPDLGNTVHVPSLREMASRVFGRSSASGAPLLGVDNDAQVDVLSGSFVMFRRSAWDEVGGLDDRYFLYCEEVDLFYRLAQRGHTFWRISTARGFHDIGHGESASPMRQLYLHAGIMQFVKLHWSKPKQVLAVVLIWLGAAERFFAGKIFSVFSSSAQGLVDKHRLIVLRTSYWRHGYDPQRGLLSKLRS